MWSNNIIFNALNHVFCRKMGRLEIMMLSEIIRLRQTNLTFSVMYGIFREKNATKVEGLWRNRKGTSRREKGGTNIYWDGVWLSFCPGSSELWPSWCVPPKHLGLQAPQHLALILEVYKREADLITKHPLKKIVSFSTQERCEDR
jgi:hypothetical protein